MPTLRRLRASAASGARCVGAPVLVLSLYFVAQVAWLVGQWGGAARRTAIADAFVLPLVLFLVLAAWRTAREPSVPAHVRRAWRWLTRSYALLAAGNVLWVYSDLVPGADWLSDWVRGFVFASYLPLLVGLLLLPDARRARQEQVRFGLDWATVLLGAGLVFWFVIANPTGRGSVGRPAISVITLFTPAADFAVLAAIVALLLGRLEGSSRAALRLLAAGHMLTVAAELVAVWLSRGAGLVPGHWVEGLSALSVILMVAAADAQWRQARRPPAAAQPPEQAAPAEYPGGYSLLPYVGVALGLALLLVVTRPWWGEAVGVVVFGTAALCTLVVVRQVLALRDNRRLAEERDAERARLAAVIAQMPAAVFIAEAPSGRLVLGNGQVEHIFGRTVESAWGADGADVIFHQDVRPVAPGERPLARAVGGERSQGEEYRYRRPDGAEVWVRVSAGPVRDRDGQIVAGVAVAEDVTERRRLEAELAHQAFHDPLTGLANRALFRDRVGQALAHTARAPGRVAVLFLDLDGFKAVNDTLGHHAGDQLLVQVAARLRAATRGSDTVARLGGDEFAVLLDGAVDDGEAVIVAERILAGLAHPVVAGGRAHAVGASVGVASAGCGGGADELLRNADVAMYRAKARGRGGYEVFAPEMYEALRDRLALEDDLRGALDRGECCLAYQPILDLHTERVVGVEALVRWHHPERGVVPPAVFIPMAEESGAILALGRWVLGAACREAATWRGAGAGREPNDTPNTTPDDAPNEAPYVAVNISGRQLQCPGLPADVAGALAGAGLEPGALLLEITEGVVMRDTERTLETLRALKALGVRIAIDDFGTGYSSLSYLQRFPVDVLKIDKAFVDRVAQGGSDAALTRTIIALGETLGLRTVAEGVEDVAQQAALRALGCDLGQGYLFARPLAPADLARLLARAPGAARVTGP